MKCPRTRQGSPPDPRPGHRRPGPRPGPQRLRRRQREAAAAARAPSRPSTAPARARRSPPWTPGAARSRRTNSDVTVNYDPSGSGAGVEKFNAGGIDFAASDSALDADKGEIDAAKKRCGADAIEVPNYVSPIAVVYNVEGVNELQLSAKTIAEIFDGKITKWNDAAIEAENTGAKLPSTTITPVHRSDESGTTENFTDYLEKAGEGAWTHPADKVWPIQVRRGRQRHLRRDRRGRPGRRLDRLRRPQPGRRPHARVKIKVGVGVRRAVRRGRREGARGLAAGGRSPGERPRGQGRPHVDRGRCLPAAAGVVPDRLPDLRRRQDGRQREGVPQLRRLDRGPAGGRRQRRLRSAPGVAPGEGREDRRHHLVEGLTRHPCRDHRHEDRITQATPG